MLAGLHKKLSFYPQVSFRMKDAPDSTGLQEPPALSAAVPPLPCPRTIGEHAGRQLRHTQHAAPNWQQHSRVEHELRAARGKSAVVFEVAESTVSRALAQAGAGDAT